MFFLCSPRFNSLGYKNFGSRLAPQETTIAELFQEASYVTGAIVSNPVLSVRRGFTQGFDSYDLELMEWERVRTRTAERTAEQTADAARRWIEARSNDRPFFLWVHFQDPHGPYAPPDAFASRFVTSQPETFIPACQGTDNHGKGCIPWYQTLNAEQDFETYVDRYDAEIAYTDHHVGRVLDALRKRPGWKDMVIVLTADHGESMGEADYYFRHGHAVTRDQSGVPLILKHPDLQPGSRVRTPVGHIDLFPTLAAIIGERSVEDGPWSGLDLVQLRDANPPQRVLYCDIGNALGVHVGRHLLTGRMGELRTDDAIKELRPKDFEASGLSDYWGSHAAIENPEERMQALTALAHEYLARPRALLDATASEAELEGMLRSLGYMDD